MLAELASVGSHGFPWPPSPSLNNNKLPPVTNTYPSLLHHFWTTDVWAAPATSESSQFVSSKSLSFANGLLLKRLLEVKGFIYLFILKRCTSNTLFGIWFLIVEFSVSLIVSQVSTGKGNEDVCQCSACRAKFFLLPWRPSQAWQENGSRLAKMILKPQTKASTGWSIIALSQTPSALAPSDNFILFISW